MRSVEVKFVSTLDDPKAEPFSVTIEAHNGDRWDLRARNPDVYAGTDGSKTYMLDAGERLIIEPANAKPTYVFDKDQNANVRVETEAEVKDREAREANAAKSQADQSIAAAQGKVSEAQASAERAEHDANRDVKKAEAERAKIEADQAKNRAAASEAMPANPSTDPNSKPGTQTPSGTQTGTKGTTSSGNQASANTGPIDSKQVKADNVSATPHTPAKDKP